MHPEMLGFFLGNILGVHVLFNMNFGHESVNHCFFRQMADGGLPNSLLFAGTCLYFHSYILNTLPNPFNFLTFSTSNIILKILLFEQYHQNRQ